MTRAVFVTVEAAHCVGLLPQLLAGGCGGFDAGDWLTLQAGLQQPPRD